jgi:LPS sulfotransferase NodH
MNLFRATYLSVFFKIKLKQVLEALPFFKGKSYTTFLIVGHPRTGTSLLHTYLNSHAHIHSLNEPLKNTTDIEALFKPYSRMIHAVGFKYFFEYTADEEKRNTLLGMIKSRDIKVIVIRRKNQLRTFASLCIAEKTNEWSSTEISKHRLSNKQIILQKDACLQAFHTFQKNELITIEMFKQSSLPMFELTYEGLVEFPEDTMFSVQQFLGVKPQTLQSLLVRQNSEKLSTLILNYKSLKNEFEHSEFKHFFDE